MSKKENTVKGQFALNHQPHVYVIQLHMRNLLGCFKENIPTWRMELNRNNWTATYGATVVRDALLMMSRDMNGKKLRKAA